MHSARITELLEPFLEPADRRLTADDLQRISIYIDLLLRWNARINLTGIRDPEQIVTRHFGESLFAARHLFPRASPVPSVVKDVDRNHALTIADLGSGAGFPGIPIKLWAPQMHVTLIESNHKKATFLREVARALTLTDINILTARAESIAETFEVVTLRAVESFAKILPVAAALVAPAGRLALLIGSSQEKQAQATLPQLDYLPSIKIPKSDSRVLLIGTHEPGK